MDKTWVVAARSYNGTIMTWWMTPSTIIVELLHNSLFPSLGSISPNPSQSVTTEVFVSSRVKAAVVAPEGMGGRASSGTLRTRARVALRWSQKLGSLKNCTPHSRSWRELLLEGRFHLPTSPPLLKNLWRKFWLSSLFCFLWDLLCSIRYPVTTTELTFGWTRSELLLHVLAMT